MDITEYDEFYKWYKANERRFHCSQMTEVQIAYSAYLHGIEQSHNHGVSGKQALCPTCGSECIQHISERGTSFYAPNGEGTVVKVMNVKFAVSSNKKLKQKKT